MINVKFLLSGAVLSLVGAVLATATIVLPVKAESLPVRGHAPKYPQPITPLIDYAFETVMHDKWAKAERKEVARLKELTCLAKTLWGEARSESDLGQQAVANVIVNRVASPKHPNTICSVVQYKRRGIHHFSTWAPHDANYTDMQKVFTVAHYDHEVERAIINAVKVTNGLRVLPSTSVNYHATHSKPIWRLTLTLEVTIDSHTFYQ